jgi:hypothetical protein
MKQSPRSPEETGRTVSGDEQRSPRPPLRLNDENSRGKVQNVRADNSAGNIKRVASAVGESSIAIAFVHQVLQRT